MKLLARMRTRPPASVAGALAPGPGPGPGPADPALPVRWWVTLISAAVILFWVSVPMLVAMYDVPPLPAFGLATLQCLTLPLAIRAPWLAIAVHAVSVVLIGQLIHGDVDSVWPLPVVSQIVLTVFLIQLGLREKWFFAVLTWWLAFLGMTVVVVLDPEGLLQRPEWDEDVLVSVSITLAATAIAVSVGQRRRIRALVVAARRDLELEQARRATVEERARIARELHDVVAHSMSVVHIQAESARFRVTAMEEAHAEFQEIARSARAALAEMRQLLATLHPEQDEAFYAPQPRIADIPGLVASAERVGNEIEFESDTGMTQFSAVVELTAYRIVQEALSNVIRHAPGAPVSLRVERQKDVLEIRVQNRPSPVPAPDAEPADSGGLGLRGMRERVAVLHGEIEQTPLPDGGFLIAARLPIEP